jgi:hypothetical protein
VSIAEAGIPRGAARVDGAPPLDDSCGQISHISMNSMSVLFVGCGMMLQHAASRNAVVSRPRHCARSSLSSTGDPFRRYKYGRLRRVRPDHGAPGATACLT